MYSVIATLFAVFFGVGYALARLRIFCYEQQIVALTDTVHCFSRQNYENVHGFVQTLKGILNNESR